jgi:hypothetical protein
MPMFLLLVACLIALFLAIGFFFYFEPGGRNLAHPSSGTSSAPAG